MSYSRESGAGFKGQIAVDENVRFIVSLSKAGVPDKDAANITYAFPLKQHNGESTWTIPSYEQIVNSLEREDGHHQDVAKGIYNYKDKKSGNV